MANNIEIGKYDDALTSILVNEKSILGFLSTIFNFLARRTDFYHVPEGTYENMGFPPGVAEELVIKILKKCDPKNCTLPNGAQKPTNVQDLNNDIMCSTVAQEVEIVDENEAIVDSVEHTTNSMNTSKNVNESPSTQNNIEANKDAPSETVTDAYIPPVIPQQMNSESYNGAIRDQYCWSQSIMDLDVIVNLPLDIKSKDLKVNINSADICVTTNSGDIILKDSLPYKIKTIDSFWSINEGKLLIHLEKIQERWWNKLLNSEEEIDLNKIDCSRPIDDLPEDHIAKIRELQWNQKQKIKGLPTSDEIRNMDILKKAWNAEGSPFKGTQFDLSMFHPNK